jgi:hypothetical protein
MYTFNQENKFINEEFVYEDTIENCLETYKQCKEMMSYELNLETPKVSGEEINKLVECAEICCATVACLIARSAFSSDLTALCSKVCDHCKEDQIRIANGDEKILEFIQTLSICSNLCKNFDL